MKANVKCYISILYILAESKKKKKNWEAEITKHRNITFKNVKPLTAQAKPFNMMDNYIAFERWLLIWILYYGCS